MSLLKAYERIERHLAARTNATDEPASRSERVPQTAGGLGVEADPLADLLQTPIRRLTAPIAVASSILGCTIYLAANDAQAATVRATGGVPYMAEEVDLLWALYQVTSPEAWREHLRLIHEAKRRFSATVIPEESR